MSTFLQFTIVGIVTGAIYATTASGLVVTYTTSGIFNFAHGAIGMVAAFTYWELRVNHHLPAPIALVAVLFVIAPLLGAAIEYVFVRPLRGVSEGVALVVTLGLLLICLGVAQVIWDPQIGRTLPEFFAGHTVKLVGVVVTYHQLITIALAGAVAIGLRLLFYETRTGIAMRAVVDDRDLAALNGAAPARVSQLSWALGAMLAALAGVLIGSLVALDQIVLTLLVVNGYAAAMVGRLKSLPRTFAGALALGLLESYSVGYLTGKVDFIDKLRPALPTLFLFAVLVLLPQDRLRAGRLVGGRSPRLPGMKESVIAGIGFVAVAFVASTVLTGANLTNVSQGLALAIMMLSLVLLTGYGGQISLCQLTFVGLGAFAMGKFAGGGSPIGLVAAAVLAGAVGMLVALPALRLKGLYLALSTLAFALLADRVFFTNKHVLDTGGRLAVHRLELLGVGINSDKAYLVLLAAFFAAGGILILWLRRGTFGRLLAAMSDSPAACATLGLDLTRIKVTVFGVSAALAGVSGALYGGLRGSVGAADFEMLQSLFLLLPLTIGGINTVSGALIGGLGFALLNVVGDQIGGSFGAALPFLATGLGTVLLARNPDGVAGLLSIRFERFRAARPEARPTPEIRGQEVDLAGAAG
jgi:branched-chain amino acid transport system permease protein